MRKLPISLLRSGMILAKTIYGQEGQVWLNAGVKLKSNYIASLWRQGLTYVYVQDPLLDGVSVPEAISEETKSQAINVLKSMVRVNSKGECNHAMLVIDSRFSHSVEKIVADVLENKDVMVNLTDIRNADNYTFHHSVNVSVLALMTAVEMGLPRKSLVKLATGALLHDIGKIWIDEQLLNKEGSLTPAEYAEIKKHPKFGFDILSCQRSIDKDVATVVAQHHERCDGTGYPYKLPGDKIHLFARLVMVADVFDALTADRPYRKSMQPHQAIDIIIGCADAYDHEVTRIFLNNVAAYPVGTGVRLSNGDLGLVVANHKGLPLHPVVRLFKDTDGTLYDTVVDCDLAKRLDLTVTQVLDDQEVLTEFPIMSLKERA